MKVYDVFYFFDELELLEIRLNILNDYVDYFVLVDATETFMGDPKASFYEDNKERFAKWNHKIIHYSCNDYPNDYELLKMAMASPNIGNGEHYWISEFYIKESVRRALTHLDDEDIVYISDIDEIWNPAMKLDYTKDVVYKPRQLNYMFYLNQRTSLDWLGWTGTTCCKYKFIKNGIINHIRTDDLQKYEVVENGGWHFCSIAGKLQKLQKWANPHYDTFNEKIWDKRMEGARIDELDLPDYIVYNKQKYAKYFKNS